MWKSYIKGTFNILFVSGMYLLCGWQNTNNVWMRKTRLVLSERKKKKRTDQNKMYKMNYLNTITLSLARAHHSLIYKFTWLPRFSDIFLNSSSYLLLIY